MITHVMIVGVGGQGSLLGSRLLGSLAMRSGMDVKVGEVHGMSQRGGSVVTYVKYGDKVYSPVVDLAQADLIISFELLEAARYLPYLKDGGKIVTSTQQINPMPVLTGAAEYPADIISKIRACGANVSAVDAGSLSVRAGSARSANMVMLGAASKYMGFTREEWQNSIKEILPEHLWEINLAAFELGRQAEEEEAND